MSPKVRIGDIAKVGAGQGAPQDPSAFSDEGYPFIRAGSLDALCIGGDIRSLERISEARAKRHRMKLYPKSTVVFAKSGMSATKNRVFVLPEQAYVVSHLATLEVKPHVDPTWLQYFWEHYCPGNLIQDPAYPSISLEAISNVEIELPPLPEQKRIAAILAKADRLRRLRRTARDLSDTYLQSVFLEMFGDPVSNPMGWEKTKLGSLCQIIRGASPRPIKDFLGGTVPWVKIGDGTQGDDLCITSTKDHIIEEGVSKSVFLKSGSLVFANCGVSLGFARILKIDGCIHDGWLAFNEIDERRIHPVFLLKALNQITPYLRSLAPTGTQPNLNTGIMKMLHVILPPLPLQQQFARTVHKFERLRAQQDEAERQAGHLFQTLLQRAFRGEL